MINKTIIGILIFSFLSLLGEACSPVTPKVADGAMKTPTPEMIPAESSVAPEPTPTPGPTPLPTMPVSSEIIVEGFSFWKTNPGDTENQKIAMAKRAALADAHRKVIEFQKGAAFTYTTTVNTLVFAKFKSEGMESPPVRNLGCQVQENAIVICRLSFPPALPQDSKAGDSAYEVTGHSNLKSSNLPSGLLEARIDGFIQAIKQAASEKFGQSPPAKLTGKIFQVETVSDMLTPTSYTVTLKVRLSLD